MTKDGKQTLYIVDDDKSISRGLQAYLENYNYKVQTFSDPISALQAIKEKAPALSVFDIRMGDISGIDLYQRVLEEGFKFPVIFMSAEATSTEAVRAVKMGAFDFLEKPFAAEKILVTITRALELTSAMAELTEIKSKMTSPGFIGISKSFQKVLMEIGKVANTNSPVLITGESGTGKELIAREIHERSRVAKGPFIKVNCSAIPENLVESEFFGYVKGAFTGAERTKIGYFEQADGGTILLDEVGEMSLLTQAKVLRAIQNMEIQRLGSEKTTQVTVRVITATNRNLEEEVRQKRFREDLFYRINVFPIHSPPLRERKEDIPLLAEHFLNEYIRTNQVPKKTFDLIVMESLKKYSWPGNIRELKNLVERMAILSGQKIELSCLPILNHQRDTSAPEGRISLSEYKNSLERKYIVETLKDSNGNISDAAKKLDIERTYLHKMIQKYVISKREYFV